MMSSGHHLHWDAEALWEGLAPLLDGISVEVLPRCESTNTQLLERARAADGDRSPCLLVAEQQTRGRGRLGRGWVSETGASLTFSLALPMAPAQWGGLSLAVGLAIAEALDTASPHRLALKWPNDLWLLDGPGRGRKLGGILIETLPVGPQRWVVVGVGLNVAPRQAQAVTGLAHGYACLQELQPGCTAPQTLARVAVPLVRALKAFEHEGFAPLVPAYTRRDLLLGQVVSSSGGAGVSLQGTARGVDGQGALLLDSGGIHRVQSGEVSVRLAATSA